MADWFSSAIAELRRNQAALETVTRAADATPDAIRVAREAYRDGRWDAAKPIIDQEYFGGILRCRPDDPRVQTLLNDLKDINRACPTIAVEHELSSLRIRNNFKPRRSHAADLQHALIGLAYSDAFVTDDKDLREHCHVVVNTLSLPTQVCARIAEVDL